MRSLARIDEMTLSGLLSVGGAVLFVALGWADATLDLRLSVSLAVLLSAAGFVLTVRPIPGRIVATAAIAAAIGITFEAFSTRPAGALAFWLVALWVLTSLWIVPGVPHQRRFGTGAVEEFARWGRVRVATQLTALLAIAVGQSHIGQDLGARVAAVVAVLVTVHWWFRARRLCESRGPSPAFLATASVVAAFLIAAVFAPALLTVVPILALTVLAWTMPWMVVGSEGANTWWVRVLENPSRQLVATFLLLCLFGTLLLSLPTSSATGEPVPLLVAAFTSVSAVCVTGLIVVDTATAWSPSGQLIILLLIQLGGLGIMTFAAAFLSAIGRRLSLQQEGTMAEMVGESDRFELYSALRRVVLFTFGVELAGAAALTLLFHAGEPSWGTSAWRAAFTAVSAFCNAGFALQSDSLMSFQRQGLVLHVVGLLIVLGGLSPAVVLGTLRRRGPMRLQHKLAWLSTITLLVLGTILFAASEWGAALAGLSTMDKWNNAWFQSVTLRTAGFNSIDFSAVHPATATFSILWMFIGGCPGGTAGGIKTTTFVVLILSVLATVRGRPDVVVFGRTIGRETIYRATSAATLGSLFLLALLLAIQFTQDIPALPAFFEVVSATGTVGLSMGATPLLDGVGRLIIMVAMFAGRVGPLTLLVFLIAHRSRPHVRFPEGVVDVG